MGTGKNRGDHLWFPNLLDNLVRDVGRTCALGVSGDAGSTGELGVPKVRQEERGVRLGKEAPVRRAQPNPTAAAAGQLQERREVAGGRQSAGAHGSGRRRHHRHELPRVHVEPERRGAAAAARRRRRLTGGALATVLRHCQFGRPMQSDVPCDLDCRVN
jgi:hypothetical protein